MRSSVVSLLVSLTLVGAGQDAGRPAPVQAPAQAQVQTQAPVPAPAAPAAASELLAVFARMEGFEAVFEEEKHIALLAVPLKSRGRIYYLRSGYLSRVVETPERSTLVVTPSEVRLDGQDGVQRVDLRQNDHVRQFVTSLVQVFAGDEEALRRSYDVSFERGSDGAEPGAAWVLTLTPQAAPLTDLLRDLRLTGKGFAIENIEVREPGGDRTITRIIEADVQRRFTDDEKQRLFGISPR